MSLDELRERIDAVDQKIIQLFVERLAIVEDVARAKLASASPFRDRAREERLLLKLREKAVAAGIDPHQIERIYRVVMDMSVAHQEATMRDRPDAPLRISYQGVEGSFSHLAAQRRYAGRTGGALLAGFDSFRGAADAVITGAADLALLPIENSTAGSINDVYDLLAEGTLHITGEVVAPIEHCLLALPGVALAEIKTVLSHPVALAQCKAFFAEHAQLTAQAVSDTAGAAKHIADAGDRTLAAIASSAAAATYGLHVVARGVQSNAGNATRFVEISRHAAPVADGAQAKTSLLLALTDRPGALGEILVRFAGLSLTKLESRPIPETPWSYRFYIDVLGHADSDAFARALDDIRPLTTDLRVLGTYAAAL